MNQNPLNLKSLPRQIAARLSMLRRKLTFWVLIKGLSRWLLLILAILATDILIDRMFKMDFAQRVIMLVVMISLAVGLFVYRVIRPLWNRVTDDALLHEVESKHPELKENLITGAQLSREKARLETTGVSMELVDATIDRGIDLAKRVNFADALNQQKLLKNSGLLATSLAALLLLGWGVTQTDFLGTWFNRNIMLGNAQWPQATYLNIAGVENGVLVLPRGADHRLIVEVTEDSRVQDVEVSIEIDNPGGQVTHQMKATGKLGGREHLFVMHNVTSEVELRAMGGDDITDPVTIQLVEPPSILNLDMWAVYPEYAKMPRQKLEGPGPHSVLAGSYIEVTAQVNKTLSQFDLKSDTETFALQPTDQELTYSARLPADEGAELVGGQYQFDIVDETGLASIRPAKFAISIKEDAPPKVLASLLGIGKLAVPRARIPVSYNATDDLGLTNIFFHTNWKFSDAGEKDGQLGTRNLPITEIAQDAKAVRQAQDVAVVELEPFGFDSGTSFVLLVRSVDSRPGESNVSDSTDFLIRIVSEEELRADLLRREIEQRKAFQRAYDAQLELSTALQALAAKSRPSEQTEEKFNAQRQLEMIAITREQKLIGTNLDTIANRFEEYLVEAQNNRLDENDEQNAGQQTLAQRFENIIQPVRALDRELISAATRELDNCRRFLNNEDKLFTAVDTTTQLHQQILEEMKRIMNAMVQSETYQEVVNKLLEIKRGQDQIKVEVKKRKPDDEDIFDEDDIFDDN